MNNEAPSLIRKHWRILTAATVGWALDAFDMTIFFFLIPHLSKEFDVSLSAMTLIVVVTGIAKLIGTVTFGAAADKWGRKIPFMVAIIWFCAFSGLSGLAWSYASFVVFRFMFGIGFGGEWSTATSLLMESLPERVRSLASGLMMAGYEMGFFLSAFCYYVVYPELGWRWMFFLGVIPALLAIFVRMSIPESPEWLESRKQPKEKVKKRLTLTPAVWQGFGVMASANFLVYAIFALYPTYLIQVRGLNPAEVFPYIATYSIASIIGKPLAGVIAKRIGERTLFMIYMVLTIPATLLYTLIDAKWAMFAGAVLVGIISNSIFGIIPTYLSRRFKPEERGLGIGISNGFNAIGNLAPFIISIFTAMYGLSVSMTGSIILSAALLFIIASFKTDKWIVVPEVLLRGKTEKSISSVPSKDFK